MAYRERCTTAGGRVRHSVPWSTAAGGGRRPTVTTTRTGTPTTALSCPSEWQREDRCSSPITRSRLRPPRKTRPLHRLLREQRPHRAHQPSVLHRQPAPARRVRTCGLGAYGERRAVGV